MKKRMISMFMAIVMALSLIPTVAMASTTSKPATPTTTISCRASDGKPTVKWNSVSGAAKYEVYRATKKTGSFTKMMTTTSAKYINTSAKAGYTYYYKVRAVSSSGKVGNFSTVKYITCDCAQPNVSISRNSANKPHLSWKAISGAAKYDVYRSTDGGKNYKHHAYTTKTSFTNTSAQAGHTYYYKVKAISSRTSYANSAFSAAKSIKTASTSTRVYDCGYANHSCGNSIEHKAVMGATCRYCGQSGSDPNCTCPAVLGTGKCPKYSEKADPGKYCQTCGKKNDPAYHNGKTGVCAVNWVDWHCKYCGKNVPAWRCHSCR